MNIFFFRSDYEEIYPGLAGRLVDGFAKSSRCSVVPSVGDIVSFDGKQYVVDAVIWCIDDEEVDVKVRVR